LRAAARQRRDVLPGSAATRVTQQDKYARCVMSPRRVAAAPALRSRCRAAPPCCVAARQALLLPLSVAVAMSPSVVTIVATPLRVVTKCYAMRCGVSRYGRRGVTQKWQVMAGKCGQYAVTVRHVSMLSRGVTRAVRAFTLTGKGARQKRRADALRARCARYDARRRVGARCPRIRAAGETQRNDASPYMRWIRAAVACARMLMLMFRRHAAAAAHVLCRAVRACTRGYCRDGACRAALSLRVRVTRRYAFNAARITAGVCFAFLRSFLHFRFRLSF